jgi:hypothetical protein
MFQRPGLLPGGPDDIFQVFFQLKKTLEPIAARRGGTKAVKYYLISKNDRQKSL